MRHVMHQQSARPLIKNEVRNKKVTTSQGAAAGPNMSMLLDDQWMNTLLTFGSFHHACH
jgi:hypothetical protein